MVINLNGVFLGFFMLFVIGIGFLWVIKLEYYVGAWVWKGVLALGVLICVASLFVLDFTASALLGIFGGSVVWGAMELPGQEERVQRGLFPANPKRKRREGQA
jgi:hypothetical protein